MNNLQPIPVHYARSRIPLQSGVVYGARVPVGPRGIYVGNAGHYFHYAAQDIEEGLPTFTRTGLGPESLAAEIAARSNQTDLFRVYRWVVGIAVLFTLFAVPGLAIVLFVGGLVGGYFVRRWDRTRRTTGIYYDVDSPEVIGRLALCNVIGEAFAHSQRLWHVASQTAVYNRKYHAGASSLVGRVPTQTSNRAFPGVDANIGYWSVPVGPIQLLFLPDQLLVRRGAIWWPLWYAELTVTDEPSRFIEEGPVPSDTQVVDRTWRFTRKDGGPDLRFNNNRQIPVVLYGEVTLTSRSGDQLTLQTSNPASARTAANAIRELARIASEVMAAPAPPAQAPRANPWAEVAPAKPPPPAPPMNPRAQAQATSVMRAVPAPRLPPPLPPALFRPPPPPVREPSKNTEARFLDGGEPLHVAGRSISKPLTYVASHVGSNTDASTIVTSLAVGEASRALPLPYWPRYSAADADQRARYLDWMAGGRVDPSIAIGYVFIFFYGLERRALRDEANVDLARSEVSRLLEIYDDNGSFRHYASDFLIFTHLRDPRAFLTMSAADIESLLLPLMAQSELAQAAVAAWYHSQRLPLPPEYAAIFVRNMEFARRGAVVARSADELLALFRIRYREAFGDGLVLEAAKRPLSVEYRAASSTSDLRSLSVSLPNVFKKVGQFSKILRVWNDCVDALRKSTSKKRGATELDAAAWAALPNDLRAEYDHPDQDKWDGAISAAPILASYHLTTVGALATLAGVDASEKVTPAQLKRVGQRAADVGYALEPELRLRTRGAEPTSEVLAWRMEEASTPDAQVHGGISAMLSLAMTVAMADGVFAPEEDAVITSFLAEMFPLDDAMRARIEAMKQLVIRDPERTGNVAKALRAGRSLDDLKKIANVLVAIAAADGIIAETEEKALKRLYRDLGLPAADFGAAIAKTGARLERDKPVEVQSVDAPTSGVPIPPRPSGEPRALQLDQAAIDAIVADTKDVAAILAEVFESGEPEPASRTAIDAPTSSAATPSLPTALPRASEKTSTLARNLDVRYHAALEELLEKTSWPAAEIRELGTRQRLMPNAILETINWV